MGILNIFLKLKVSSLVSFSVCITTNRMYYYPYYIKSLNNRQLKFSSILACLILPLKQKENQTKTVLYLLDIAKEAKCYLDGH